MIYGRTLLSAPKRQSCLIDLGKDYYTPKRQVALVIYGRTLLSEPKRQSCLIDLGKDYYTPKRQVALVIYGRTLLSLLGRQGTTIILIKLTTDIHNLLETDDWSLIFFALNMNIVSPRCRRIPESGACKKLS